MFDVNHFSVLSNWSFVRAPVEKFNDFLLSTLDKTNDP